MFLIQLSVSTSAIQVSAKNRQSTDFGKARDAIAEAPEFCCF